MKVLFHSLRARLTFYTLLVCSIVFCSAWVVFYTYSVQREKEMAMENTISQLENALHHADQHLQRLEIAAQLYATDIEDLQNERERQYAYMDELLHYDSLIKGAGLYYVPSYKDHRKAYSYYYIFKDKENVKNKDSAKNSVKNSANAITRTSWHSEDYDFDYTVEHWYSEALKQNRPLWSEPYHEEDGNRIITTYSVPIHDTEGKVFAVMLIDIGLRHFTHIVDRVRLRDDSKLFMLSREGQVLTYHRMSPQINYDLVDYVKRRDKADIQPVVDEMLRGKSGAMIVEGNEKYIAFYASLKEKGWSLCNICSYDDIMSPVDQIMWIALLIFAVGIAVLLLCIHLLFRHEMRPVDTMESDLRIASGLQAKLLPEAAPKCATHANLDLYASLTPAREVGGDLYDYLFRDGRLFFIVGDVSGKGVPAAIFMSMTDIVFRTAAKDYDSPAEIVSHINNALAEKNETMMFVTLFVGVLDLHSGLLRYCNAGHNAPLTVTTDGEVEALNVKPNLSAGLMKDFPYSGQEHYLGSDALLIYTDGVTEAFNNHHQLFGEERLRRMLMQSATENGEKVVGNIVHGVRSFEAGAEPSDDLTLLYLRLNRKTFTLSLTNKLDEIKKLPEFVRLIATAGNILTSEIKKLNLALEEALVNVISYAYPDGEDGKISLSASYDEEGSEWTFVITDSGKPFDPTAAPAADTTLPLSDRPVGGLGIFLVRQLMDSVEYTYANGENRLIMKLKVKS